MTIRLYLDEDSMSRALARGLRARGLDVATAVEVGLIERADLEHLEYAAAHGSVLYTFNAAHFFRLHTEFLSQGRRHGGIIVAPQQRYTVGE